MPLTFDQWKAATLRVNYFRQSKELKALTNAFEVHNQRRTPASQANLKSALKAWEGAGEFLSEMSALRPSSLVGIRRAAGATSSVTTGSSGVRPIGYRLYAPGDVEYEDDGDTLLKIQPPLNNSQIMILNECMNRCRRATRLARNAMINVTGAGEFTHPMTRDQTRYEECFGAYDSARAKTVLNNFKRINQAFQNPIVFDHRSSDFFTGKGDGYAAAHRGNEMANVKIWLGYDFFADRLPTVRSRDDARQAYLTATDATTGTLIHEFAHATIRAVDPPRVDSMGNWELMPNGEWETPDNDKQASGREQVRRVAAKEPRAAIVAADSYGIFAALSLSAAERLT